MSANNKTSVFRYKSLYSPRVWIENRCHTLTAHNYPRIQYRLLTSYKMIHAVVTRFPSIFRRSQCTRTEKCLCVWSKFSADKLQNSRCIIRSLSLLRYDANLSKLRVRNLYESIKRNFMLFFSVRPQCFEHFSWMRYIFLLSEVNLLVLHTLQLFPW